MSSPPGVMATVGGPRPRGFGGPGHVCSRKMATRKTEVPPRQRLTTHSLSRINQLRSQNARAEWQGAGNDASFLRGTPSRRRGMGARERPGARGKGMDGPRARGPARRVRVKPRRIWTGPGRTSAEPRRGSGPPVRRCDAPPSQVRDTAPEMRTAHLRIRTTDPRMQMSRSRTQSAGPRARWWCAASAGRRPGRAMDPCGDAMHSGGDAWRFGSGASRVGGDAR